MTKTSVTLKSSKPTLIPTAGYLLVEPVENQKQTASGIFLPDSKEEQPQVGHVLSVGADHVSEFGIKISAPAEKGDKVVYKKWGGNEVKFEGKDYQLLKFEDLLAIIK